MAQGFDVVVIGGAAIGSAVAYFLSAQPGFKGRVLVLERDPRYTECATTRSLASIRHQFSNALNIRMSLFGTRFLRQAHEHLAVDGDAPALGFREGGYLFLASPSGLSVLQTNHLLQRAEGADVALLEPAALAARFPWLRTHDIAGGSLGQSGEGWFDPHALLHGFRRKALAQGVTYRAGQVVALRSQGRRASEVIMADGSRVHADWFVNAAGTGAAALARSAGIDLPVQSRKRCVFHFRSPAPLPGCPLVIDPTGLYFRPEGAGFLCGIAPAEHEDPECFDFSVPADWFEERLWPALAHRVPGFEAARLMSAWAGHYDVNLLDANAILGPHPDVDNLLFANGFSGHGLQQSPAVGRALSEWIVHGGYRSLDLSALGWERVIQQRPLRELNVV